MVYNHDFDFWETEKVAKESQRIGDVLVLDRYLTKLSNLSSCYDAIKFHNPVAVINAAGYANMHRADSEQN